MNNYTIQPGDKIERKKALGIYHEGIMYYNDTVFHNAPGRGEHLSSFEEFAHGKPVTVFPQPQAIRINILNSIGDRLRKPKPYSPTGNNCEHTVSRAISGTPHSPTLATVVALTIICGCIYLNR